MELTDIQQLSFSQVEKKTKAQPLTMMDPEHKLKWLNGLDQKLKIWNTSNILNSLHKVFMMTFVREETCALLHSCQI